MKSYLTRVRDKKIRNGYITMETMVVMDKKECFIDYFRLFSGCPSERRSPPPPPQKTVSCYGG